jgi:transcriptional regulator with XRE-family HTH domain
MVAHEIKTLQPPVAHALLASGAIGPTALGGPMRKLDMDVWVSWRVRAEGEKKDARKTDADLAAEISELLETHEVSRATVNHWWRGRRDPSLPEFMALCRALGADPGYILLNVRTTHKALPETSTAAQALANRGASPAYLTKSATRLKGARKVPKAKPVKVQN